MQVRRHFVFRQQELSILCELCQCKGGRDQGLQPSGIAGFILEYPWPIAEKGQQGLILQIILDERVVD